MLDFIGQTLHTIGVRIEGWREYHRAYNELLSLDDRALADIGITRTEIPFLLRRSQNESRARPGAANENISDSHRVAA